MPVGGGVICRSVIAERGLSGASHLVGLTVEGWYSQTTFTAMPSFTVEGWHTQTTVHGGKTLLSEKYGDKYDRKCTFPYRKGMPRVPSSAGYFFVQLLLRPIGRLYRENSGFWNYVLELLAR